MKQLAIERSIGVYPNDEDERLYDVILNIDTETLKSIVKPNDDDPLLYDGYILEEPQLQKLNKYTSELISLDFSKYYYVLQCLGIYE